MTGLAGAIRDALQAVLDPCSVAVGCPLSVVDMGLVAAVEAEADGRVRIRLRPTSPMCTLVASLMEAAERRAGTVAGVTAVEVVLETAGLWTEECMTGEGRRRLAVHRQGTSPPAGSLATAD